jgi:hypothetical protein
LVAGCSSAHSGERPPPPSLDGSGGTSRIGRGFSASLQLKATAHACAHVQASFGNRGTKRQPFSFGEVLPQSPRNDPAVHRCTSGFSLDWLPCLASDSPPLSPPTNAAPHHRQLLTHTALSSSTPPPIALTKTRTTRRSDPQRSSRNPKRTQPPPFCAAIYARQSPPLTSRSRHCLAPCEKERSHADSRITQRRPSPAVHRLVAIARNGWSRSIGAPDRDQSE